METEARQDVARRMLAWSAKLGDGSEWGEWFAETAEVVLHADEPAIRAGRYPRCGATTAAGSACRMVVREDGWSCWQHEGKAP